MEEHLSTSSVLLNVGIQVLNLIIFFLLFKYFLGDKVAKGLEEREHLAKKLKNAESEYNEIINQAELKKENILSEALHRQKNILNEGEILNKKLSKEILEDAQRKAEIIIQQASSDTKRIQDELANNRETAVKETTRSVVKKLFNGNKDLQDDYIKTLIKDLD